jgi:hypothetical protein
LIDSFIHSLASHHLKLSLASASSSGEKSLVMWKKSRISSVYLYFNEVCIVVLLIEVGNARHFIKGKAMSHGGGKNKQRDTSGG